MKKNLIIGFVILIVTNAVVLSGVAYNRSGLPLTQLTFTERELSFPYSYVFDKENSGISLNIDWRISSSERDPQGYNKQISLSKNELLALGFSTQNSKDNYWIESRALFWAMEFDGDLYKAEVKKAEQAYQEALLSYQQEPNSANENNKTELQDRLTREKTKRSRLFFAEASADYQALADKFSAQQNIVIVKGVAKPYYNQSEKTYKLRLNHMLIRTIMVPHEYSDTFTIAKTFNSQDEKSLTYTVDIKWGKRLEPWVVGVNNLSK